MAVLRPLYGHLPDRVIRHVALWTIAHRPLDSRDRLFLAHHLLPYIAAIPPRRVLFVGCRWYTLPYAGQFDARLTEYWTNDIDPEAMIYGGRLADIILRIHEHAAPASFDAVILNGVFGWGVDTSDAMNRAIEAIAAVMAPTGSSMRAKINRIGCAEHLIRDCSLVLRACSG
jgi:hypothetical protein